MAYSPAIIEEVPYLLMELSRPLFLYFVDRKQTYHPI
jgi:hypothetical protein